jgi:hypothetical protein
MYNNNIKVEGGPCPSINNMTIGDKVMTINDNTGESLKLVYIIKDRLYGPSSYGDNSTNDINCLESVVDNIQDTSLELKRVLNEIIDRL